MDEWSISPGMPERLRARLATHWSPPRRYPARLTIKSEGSFVFLHLVEIAWVEAQGDYVKFHAGAGTCLARMTMKTMERQLDPAKFLRIHRSCFVNIDHIHRIAPSADRYYSVHLRDGTPLRISDACWPRVREFFEAELGDHPGATAQHLSTAEAS